MNRLLLFIILLIIYGSLYPFKFSGQIPSFDQTWNFLNNYNLRTTRSDIIANIILFIPYGFVARISLNRYRYRLRGAIVLINIAVILAFTLQYLQFFLPARVPDASDAIYNIIGVFVGLMLSHLLIQYSHNHIPTNDNHRTSWSQVSIPLMLAILWICWRWFPFIPLPTPESIIASLNPILNKPQLDLFVILRDGIGWLIFFFLLTQPPFDKQPRLRVLKYAFVILGIELFIINNQLTVNDLLATLGAFALYASLDLNSIRRSLGWGVLIAMILTWLAPLSNPEQATTMNWVPFASYMQTNPWPQAKLIIIKLYLISTLILVCRMQWFDYKMATFMSLLVVIMLIIAQAFIGTYKPDITDTFAVLVLGWAMFLIDKQASEERDLAMKS